MPSILIVPYVQTDWVNNTTPAINEDNLNHIEEGIGHANTALIEMGDIPVGGFSEKVGNVLEETGAFKVVNMVYMTQASYDALTPIASTLYVIKG